MPGNRYAAALDPQQGTVPPPQMPPPDAAPPQGAPPDQAGAGGPPEMDPHHPSQPHIQEMWAQIGPYVLQFMQQNPEAFKQLMAAHGIPDAEMQALLRAAPQGAPSAQAPPTGGAAPHWLNARGPS